MSVPLADFDTGAILSWALPLAVLMGVLLWLLAWLWREVR
jgi:hypothetical protein